MAKYLVGNNILSALIKQESGGNPNAISPKGARGLTQIMPATAKNPGYGVKPLQNNTPEEQVRFTRDYMGALLKENGGDLNKALAAYNAGQGAVNKAGGVPDFKETKNYVAKILHTLNPVNEAQGAELPASASANNDPGDWVTDSYPNTNVAQTSNDPGDWVNDAVPTQQSHSAQQGGLTHKLEVGARGAIEGAAAIPGQLYNASQMLPQMLAEKIGYAPLAGTGLELPKTIDTEKAGTKLADILGLDKATDNDNIVYPVGKGIGGFVVPVTGAAKFGTPALKALAVKMGGNAPVAAIAGITSGKTLAEMAREYGAGEKTQMAADIAGNLATGLGSGVMSAVARTGTRAAKAAAGTGLEAVAGRTLNRVAGEESPQIIEALASGKVPTIENAIKGYKPTTSQIAGNPGISSIMRQNQLDVDSLSQLGARQFSNENSLIKNLGKISGKSEKIAPLESGETQSLYVKGKNIVDAIAEPMRQRNLPVDMSRVHSAIDSAIARHESNPAIISGLEAIKSEMPQSGAGFNSIYNFKQYIDQTLRGKSFADPKLASIERAGSALNDVKKELSSALEEAEPGFKDYVKAQAINLKNIASREAGAKAKEAAQGSQRMISNTAGQEEIVPVTANKLESLLKNKELSKTLTSAQKRVIENTARHARLKGREMLGMGAGSNTAQNLSIKNAIQNDLIAAGLGESRNIAGKASEKILNLGSSIANPVIGKLAEQNRAALSKIFLKAELDPKYAAELMKTYGLGHLNFNDPAGRAALRALITQTTTTQK